MAFAVHVLNFAAWAAAWAHPVAGAAARACAFQAPAYLSAWLDTIGRARETAPLFLQVDALDGARVMLLALGLERRHGLNVLGFLDGGVVDYAGPVRLGPGADSVDPRRARLLWSSLCAALPPFDLADLDKMPAEIEGRPNPLAPLAAETEPSGWALAVDGRDPSNADSRRKRRRLEELGPVSFEIARAPATAARFLAAMVRDKTRKYLETLGVDGFDAPGYRAYFAQLTGRPELAGMVHLSALKLGDDIVASHWGLVDDDTFYYLMPAFDPGPAARYSPGRLLMEELIRWCRARGVRSFDLGHGDDGYKALLGATRRPLLRLQAPGSLAGRAALAAQKLRRVAPLKSLEKLVRA